MKKNFFEYDPSKPNDFVAISLDKKVRAEIDQKIQDLIGKYENHSMSKAFQPANHPKTNNVMEEEIYTQKVSFTGMKMHQEEYFSAKPQENTEKLDETQEEKMYKLMERSGWKRGSGLGKNEQGMITPLITKKKFASKTSIILNDITVDKETLAAITEKYIFHKKLTKKLKLKQTDHQE